MLATTPWGCYAVCAITAALLLPGAGAGARAAPQALSADEIAAVRLRSSDLLRGDTRAGELSAAPEITLFDAHAFKFTETPEGPRYVVPLKYRSLQARNDLCVALVLKADRPAPPALLLGGEPFDGDEVVPSCVAVLGVAFRRSDAYQYGIYLVRTRAGAAYRNHAVVLREDPRSGQWARDERLTKTLARVYDPPALAPVLREFQRARSK